METKSNYKRMLRSIVKDDTKPEDPFKTVRGVVNILGSTDAELRDELGYGALIELLIHQKQLSHEELRILWLDALSDQQLFFKIGEEGTDSVFRRSFTSLLITLLIHRDHQDHFLNERDFQVMLESLIDYCQLERDDRGFVKNKGWAHAPAHVADAIVECVVHRYATHDCCQELWQAILHLLNHASKVYDADEDERLATATTSMVTSKKISLSTLTSWLKEVEVEKVMHKQINRKHFVRCVCLRLLGEGLSIKDLDILYLETLYNPVFFNTDEG
ncbi:DUF2785 domain-containing protein [Halobacillus locisalis]|uniref:DUF2785 domain-containing protein n=1 Tax=Halobacillus locisalis TaxID=220753 RepID=A0A838CQS9_9BACI|nr:DUF2785 domain-containing protein [Halobacillus locisalis]MBA2174223.1 DUF2785 domain-containing protein [Halobacillus locisalis]